MGTAGALQQEEGCCDKCGHRPKLCRPNGKNTRFDLVGLAWAGVGVVYAAENLNEW